MTPEQIALVQRSFAHVAPIANTAAALFYQRLFELDPSLRMLFRGDMQAQGQKLMAMLTLVVSGLSRLDELVPVVQRLGQRHAGYGVQAEHYDTVGAALIWTLQQGLGAAFTLQVEAAWVAAYTLLAETMQASVEVLATA
ncbi:MAG: hemin receptor [Chloroflexales bacterium]|nr:hemin receptor [Chloroflexales bacterium]